MKVQIIEKAELSGGEVKATLHLSSAQNLKMRKSDKETDIDIYSLKFKSVLTFWTARQRII